MEQNKQEKEGTKDKAGGSQDKKKDQENELHLTEEMKRQRKEDEIRQKLMKERDEKPEKEKNMNELSAHQRMRSEIDCYLTKIKTIELKQATD